MVLLESRQSMRIDNSTSIYLEYFSVKLESFVIGPSGERPGL